MKDITTTYSSTLLLQPEHNLNIVTHVWPVYSFPALRFEVNSQMWLFISFGSKLQYVPSAGRRKQYKKRIKRFTHYLRVCLYDPTFPGY